MRTILTLILLTAVAVPAALAQTGDVPEPTLWQELAPLLITAVVPLAIALGRKLIPVLPKWLLPILAPLLGVALSFVLDAATGIETGAVLAAVYGGLGTWLREMIKQINQASQPQIP